MPAVQETVEQVRRIDVDQYKYGFVTDIESEKAPKGLDEDTVRHELEGNICRCTGYHNIVKSVLDAAGRMKVAQAAE